MHARMTCVCVSPVYVIMALQLTPWVKEKTVHSAVTCGQGVTAFDGQCSAFVMHVAAILHVCMSVSPVAMLGILFSRSSGRDECSIG